MCRDARIVLGAVASTPREVPEAARALVGQPFGPEAIARAAEAAARPAKPLDNTDLVYHYRKRMTRVYVARALRELAGLPLEGLWPSGMSARAVEEAIAAHGVGVGRRDVAPRVVRGAKLGRRRLPAVRRCPGRVPDLRGRRVHVGHPHAPRPPALRERGPAPGTAEEVRLASEGFLAYCGTYEVDEPRGIIVHRVTAADFPNNRRHGPGPALRDGERHPRARDPARRQGGQDVGVPPRLGAGGTRRARLDQVRPIAGAALASISPVTARTSGSGRSALT